MAERFPHSLIKVVDTLIIIFYPIYVSVFDVFTSEK